MVVTVQHNATDAGVEILKQGGNAVDAAVAVHFALAVTYPFAGNLGGGGFMLIRDKHGKAHFLDYREKAPAAATRDMYLDAQGNIVPGMSLIGYKASGVPGSVAGITYAQKHYGKLTLAQDMAPAIRLATEGFVLTDAEARMLQTSRSVARFPAAAHIYQRDGNFYKEGDTFKQPELAATLTRIAKDPDEFYHGAMAHQIADAEKAGGGLITAEDLAAYQVKERDPIRGHYRGYDIVTAPPPSSGGIVLIEILNILSGYNLAKLGPDRSTPQVHIITEAFRRAYMDRSDYLGDPDFNNLPLKQMANPKYAAAWRASIDTTNQHPARPRPPRRIHAAPTISNDHKRVQRDHTLLHRRLQRQRRLQHHYPQRRLRLRSPHRRPRLPNEQRDGRLHLQNRRSQHVRPHPKLSQLHRPGKRRSLAMTPTIITTHGSFFHHAKLTYVMGTPGGSTIITTVANDVISAIDNQLDIQAVADAPRFHHQYIPDRLDFEKKIPRRYRQSTPCHGLRHQPQPGRRRQKPRHLGRQRTHSHQPQNPRTARRPRQPPQLRQSRWLLSCTKLLQKLLRPKQANL